MSRIILILSLFLAGVPAWSMDFATFSRRPRLTLVLVIDQFRADYLTRYRDKFLPAGNAGAPGGFRFLLENGAYFPFAEYDVLQNMTCSGHAMILTGTRPHLNGIALNDWYDRRTKKQKYCATDPQYGVSPRQLLTTTEGDELKNVEPEAKVVTVAIKDRAAVMLGGRRADSAVWFDNKKHFWTSSSYYGKGSADWLAKVNASQAAAFTGVKLSELLSSTATVGLTVDTALAALESFSLGADPAPDLLAVSFSSHDYLGHRVGPNSPLMLQMTLTEDREIARLLRAAIRRAGGLENLNVVLTADHGTPPSVPDAQAGKLDAGIIEYPPLIAKMNKALNAAFGTPKSKSWIAYAGALQFYFDEQSLHERKRDLRQAERVAQAVLLKEPGVLRVLTSAEFLDGTYRNGPLAAEIERSYLPGISGDLVILPRPFFMEGEGYPVNHITNWAYDRTVPLVILSAKAKPGVYSGAKVIDLAPTLSFFLGTLPSATNEGRVLSEILK
jgi:predicted AlkP superfamily pyrophosphatase or phosphodiesterase